MVHDNVKLLPGVALSLSYIHRDGNYVFVYDIAAFDWKKALSTPDATRALMGGSYYICHALCSDLEAVRRGIVLLCECSDFDWRKNINIDTSRKMYSELLVGYPIQYNKIKYFNAGMFLNMTNSLKKRFLPKKITDKMEVGCRTDTRLSELYCVPNLEACHHRLLGRIDECIAKRYSNMRTFRLTPPREH